MKGILNLCLNPALDIHLRMERLNLGGEDLVLDRHVANGGKGYNIARFFKARQMPLKTLLLLSEQGAEAFEEAAKEEKLDLDLLYVKAPLRQNMTIHESSGRETRVIDDRFGVTQEEWQMLLTRAEAQLDACDVLIFTGRLPRGVNAYDLLPLLQEAKRRGLKIVLDSKSFQLEHLSHVSADLIKPNVDEAQAYLEEARRTQREPDVAATLFQERPSAEPNELQSLEVLAQETLERTQAQEILLSCGAKGLRFLSRTRACYAIEVPQIQPKSTIGAGDMALASFLWKELTGATLTEALTEAAATATASCLHETLNIPDLDEVQCFSKRVTLRKIEGP